MLDFLKRIITGGLVVVVIYGLGRFINYLGFLSRRHKLWMLVTLPILAGVIIIFSSLYVVESEPIVISVGFDNQEKINKLSIKENAVGVEFQVDHIDGNKLYLKDRSGREYLSILPSNLQDGGVSTRIVPKNDFLYGWLYVLLKINSKTYLHFRFMNSIAAILTIGAVLGVYFYGAIEGKRAHLTLRK